MKIANLRGVHKDVNKMWTTEYKVLKILNLDKSNYLLDTKFLIMYNENICL